MTKIFTPALLVLLSFSAKAQIDKGNYLLTGNVSFAHSKIENTASNMSQSVNSALVSVKFGKAFSTNNVAGVYVSVAPNKTTYKGSPGDDTKAFGFGGGFFVRHFQPLGNKFSFYTDLDAGYNQSWRKNTNNGQIISKWDTKNANLSFTPGVAYRLSKPLLLSLSLPQVANLGFYTYNNTNNGVETKQTSFGFSSSIGASALQNLSLGLTLVF